MSASEYLNLVNQASNAMCDAEWIYYCVKQGLSNDVAEDLRRASQLEDIQMSLCAQIEHEEELASDPDEDDRMAELALAVWRTEEA